MDDFLKSYENLKELIENDLFDNDDRNKLLFKAIKDLKSLWPDEDIEEITYQLQDYPWRVKRIYQFIQFDDETISEEIDIHGFSLVFLDARNYLSDEDQEDILHKFYNLAYKSDKPKISSINRIVAGKLKKIQKIQKRKEPESKNEALISELNKLPKHNWEILFTEASEWELEGRFIKILKSLIKPKSVIKKSDMSYVVDMFVYLIEKNYIYEINSSEKSELTKKLTYNALIEAFEEHAKKT